MKKIFLMLMAAATLFTACKKEEKATVSANIAAPKVTVPTSGTTLAVTAADTNKTVKIKWDKADYGVQAVVSYFIQIDSAGRNFTKKATITTTGADSVNMTLGALNNQILNTLKLAPNVPSAIELRTGAHIYGKDTVYSAPVKLMVTTYKELAPVKLYVPGAYQGWNPGAALSIPAVTTYTYEGYIYMSVGDQFKFTTAPDWNHINYGAATTAGKLTTDGMAGGVSVNKPGFYKLNADIKNLTWSAYLVNSWGLIGPASAGSWDNSTPMTYNQARNVWTITTNLNAGALKFRANNAWDLNYGPASSDALTGTLISTDAAVTITQAGNYTITLDFSQAAQNKYLYTITKN